jgi:hypothetical protein
LSIPGITFTTNDQTGLACGQPTDSTISTWELINSTFWAVKCTSGGYYPVVTAYYAPRTCVSLTAITDCVLYRSDYKCYACINNKVPFTLNSSGSLTNQCVPSYTQTYNCNAYTNTSGTLNCTSCETNFTFSTVNSVKVCIRNEILSVNCNSYALNNNNTWECTACVTGYILNIISTYSGDLYGCIMNDTNTNFNYVYNSKFLNNTCTSTQLTNGYQCTVTSFEISYHYCYGYSSNCSQSYFALEGPGKFETNMTGVVITPLDYLYTSNSTYYRRGFDIRVYPIYAGTYKLSWSAMTRKTGSPSTYSYMVSVHDYGKYNTYLNNKTYTFSSLGTQNLTETFVITNVYTNFLMIVFNGAMDTTYYPSPVGAGITNIRFEKIGCGANETATLLSNGETACIENYTIESVNYCTQWTYHHAYQPSGASYIVVKAFSC